MDATTDRLPDTKNRALFFGKPEKIPSKIIAEPITDLLGPSPVYAIFINKCLKLFFEIVFSDI
jgi:hypothetical protein